MGFHLYAVVSLFISLHFILAKLTRLKCLYIQLFSTPKIKPIGPLTLNEDILSH